MPPVYSQPATLPDRGPLSDLLGDYYGFINARINAIGGPQLSVPDLVEDFWTSATDYLPPKGVTVLAHDDQGRLLGCGMLKDLGNGQGELKRLFVRDSARGLGVGRTLVTLRIEAARDMGLGELLVDTLKNNVEMLGLYRSLGFEETAPFAQSTTYDQYPELGEIMVFLKRRL